MTLWIKNLYLLLAEKYINSYHDDSHRELKLLTKLFANQLLLQGLVKCSYTGICILPNDKYKYYSSYSSYTNNLPSYSTYLDSHIADGIVTKCHFTGVYFSGGIMKVRIQDEHGKISTFLTTSGYAKTRLDIDWWYDKANLVYTNYEFDYPACNLVYKGSPRFWRHPGKEEVWGHEFELKFASFGHKVTFAELIKAKFRPCIVEKDGSLDLGDANGPSCELITPPWTYDESISKLTEIFNLAMSCQVKKRISDGYAWHITLNLLSAPDPSRAGNRFMYLINHPELRSFWEGLARRKSKVNPATGKNYCQYELLEEFDLENGKLGMDLSKWYHRWMSRPINHYFATFLRKCGSAIELRILKSSVDISVVAATLEVLKIAWEFSKSDEVISPTTWRCQLHNCSSKTSEFLHKIFSKNNW